MQLKTQMMPLFAFVMLLAAGCAGPVKQSTPLQEKPPDAGTFTIKGTLTDSNGAKVADALVILLEEREDGSKPHGQDWFTNPNGVFSPFTAAADGKKRYQLVIYSNPYEMRYPHDESLFEARSAQGITLSKDGSSFQPKSQQQITLTATLPLDTRLSEKGNGSSQDGRVVIDLKDNPNRAAIVQALDNHKPPEHLKEELHGKKMAVVLDSKEVYFITIDGTETYIEKQTIPTDEQKPAVNPIITTDFPTLDSTKKTNEKEGENP